MVINMISGPRNISTALMYSFAQRADTIALDEPFYGHYLLKTGIEHPGREETISSQEKDPEKVIANIRELQESHPIVFVKNMAHHHEVMSWDYMKDFRNILLIRDPKQLIASFAQVIKKPTMLDIGLKNEAELLDFILEKCTHSPIVIDSNNILSNPERGLSVLCKQLNIEFDAAMLSWESGAKPEDGTWAKYWYKNVHNSTGFAKQSTSDRPLPQHCEPLYEAAMLYYEKLASFIN